MLKTFLTNLRKQRCIGADSALSQVGAGWSASVSFFTIFIVWFRVLTQSLKNSLSPISKKLQTSWRDTLSTAKSQGAIHTGKMFTTPSMSLLLITSSEKSQLRTLKLLNTLICLRKLRSPTTWISMIPSVSNTLWVLVKSPWNHLWTTSQARLPSISKTKEILLSWHDW